jgi:hypothetical protein
MRRMRNATRSSIGESAPTVDCQWSDGWNGVHIYGRLFLRKGEGEGED